MENKILFVSGLIYSLTLLFEPTAQSISDAKVKAPINIDAEKYLNELKQENEINILILKTKLNGTEL
jgi:hypothetical protein